MKDKQYVTLRVHFIVGDEVSRPEVEKIASNLYGTMIHAYGEGWITDGLDSDHIDLQAAPIVLFEKMEPY